MKESREGGCLSSVYLSYGNLSLLILIIIFERISYLRYTDVIYRWEASDLFWGDFSKFWPFFNNDKINKR